MKFDVKTTMKSTTILAAILLTLSLSACSNQGGSGPNNGNSGTEGPQNDGGGCTARISAGADTMTIAIAFNEYRARCNPSEAELLKEVAKLR